MHVISPASERSAVCTGASTWRTLKYGGAQANCLLANSLPNGASSCSGILRALIRLLILDVPSQPQHRGTGAGRVEGHATRGDRPLRLMWLRLTLACTPHGVGRRTELSGELQLFVPRYRSVVGGWKEGPNHRLRHPQAGFRCSYDNNPLLCWAARQIVPSSYLYEGRMIYK